MIRLAHTHCSGRYDRPGELLHQDLEDWSDDSTIITGTEANSKSRKDALVLAGWGVINGNASNADDSFILFKKSVWRIVLRHSVPVSQKTYFTSRGHKRPPIHAVLAVLEHRMTGRRILVSVIHLPSHVEGDFKTNKRRPVAFRYNLRGWKRFVNRVAKRHGVNHRLLTADWNLNYRKAWVRAWFRVANRAYRATWRKPLPHMGTHGNRIIDTSIVHNMRVIVPPHILGTVRSSDHKPFREVLSF